MQEPARYLMVIESSGSMVARLFDAQHRHLSDFDAGSEEVSVMTTGLQPTRGADPQLWGNTLTGHSAAERAAAQVYTLDV
ncbi:MAG: hypothetical protein ABI574_16785 [Burkholderiales bacterium]